MSDLSHSKLTLDVLVGLWSRRAPLAASVFTLALAASAGFAKGLPALYRATATLLVDPRGLGEAPGEAALEARLRAVEQEILSRARLSELMTRFGLYPALRAKGYIDMAVERMRHDLSVELRAADQGGGRSITGFTVSYQTLDAATAAGVANAVAQLYVDENAQIRGRHASGTAAVLKTELDAVKVRLDEQERQLAEVHGGGSVDMSLRLEGGMTALERLGGQLRSASESRMRVMERRSALLKQLAEADPAASSGDPDATAVRLERLRKELAELRQKYRDSYPDVVRLKAQIAGVEREAATERSQPRPEPSRASPGLSPLRDALREVDAEVQGLKDEEERLRRDEEAWRKRVDGAPALARVVQEKARDYETTKNLYNALLKRYQEAELAEGAQRFPAAQEFRILDAALAPTQASAPGRLQLAIVGLVLSILLAAAVVVVAEHFDTSFHSIDDVRSFTRVPVLVSIPAITTPSDRRARLGRLCLFATAALVGAFLTSSATYLAAKGNDRLAALVARGRS